MQTTLKSAVECRGIDITGTTRAAIILEPAPEDTGVVFIREDLSGCPRVLCNSTNARVDSRWTSLEEDGIRVEHTEHILASIRGMGLDNVIVRMNCASIPVVDGYSCKDFARSIAQIGLQTQQACRKYIEVRKPVLVKDEFTQGDKNHTRFILALPSENLEVAYVLDYPCGSVQTQMAYYKIVPEIFLKELASARSFITKEEYRQVAPLIGRGVESLLVLSRGAVRGLRWNNEPSRHKLVDLLGDLGTAGYPLKGKFIAFRSGHQLNIELVKTTVDEGDTT